MSADPDSDDTLRAAAARWAVRLSDGDLQDGERDIFQRWLDSDDRHGEEFRAQMVILALAGELPLDQHAHLVSLARDDATEEGASPASRRRWLALAAATAAVALLGGWLGMRYIDSAQVYTTHTGETRAITFEDGSVAHLNTRTRLEWQGTATDRRVKLLEGEALFEVIPDEHRPFRVVLDNSEVRVLGTRFNVYRRQDGEVIVTVLDGRVQVVENGKADSRAAPAWSRELGANEQLAYRRVGLIRDVHPAIAQNAVKWRDGVIELEDEKLPQVIDELTRYTDRRIVIRDARLAELRFGGALNIKDVRLALSRMEKLAPIVVVETEDAFTLDYRPEEKL